jgi:hypothetical protein
MISLPLVYDVWGDQKNITPLHGAYEQPVACVLNWENWISQTYQHNRDSLYKYNTTLRPLLVRLYNEMDFKLFGKSNMGDLLFGKENYLFSHSWAESRSGKVTLDSTKIDLFCGKLAHLEQLLSQSGKFFKFIIPPSKEEIFAEFLPDNLKEEGTVNDYKILTHYLNKHHVTFDDLTDYYKELIRTAPYPVYSSTSVHWTMYGAHFTLISLLQEMNTYFDNRMIELYVEQVNTSHFQEYDGDQEKTLNLFARLDDGQFGYPVYGTNTPISPAFKPRVITIGDSYYWGIIGSWQLLSIFDEQSKYLYYFSTVFPNNDNPSYSLHDIDIIEEISQSHALIIMNSSHNLLNFPYGFENDIDAIITQLENEKKGMMP